MTLQYTIGLALALAAVLLLARDLRRAWLDQLKRPSTLLMAALVAILLAGTLGGRAHPSPWWLVVPGVILVWESCAVGVWRRAATSGRRESEPSL